MEQKRYTGIFYVFIAIVIVVVDQLVKNSIRQTIPLFATKPFLPGLMELTYVKNTGAAFSMLSRHTWLLAVISALVAIILMVVLLRNLVPSTLGKLSIALILGGAVGNFIDRIWLGYVVDMFSLQFINFAIFNVADIGVTLGGALLCISVLFYWNPKKGEAKS